MTLDVASVLSGTGARLVRLLPDGSQVEGNATASDLVREFAGVSIDSRSISTGDLFVALPGEHVDGHAFMNDALASGARGGLVSAPLALDAPRDGSTRYLFVVPDVLLALQKLAHYWRMRHDARIVGVTGSIGKTTTKDILASVLSTRWPVLRSEANLNTEIGLPLALLRLDARHHAGVLEMGMYAAGDIELLARIARPNVGIVTAIAPIHIERMGTIEAIAREKSKLVHALPSDGLAVLNADDPWTRAMAVTSGTARSVLVGRADEADYRATDVTVHGLDGLSFTLEAEGEIRSIRTHVPGVHTLHAILSAIAVARSFGMAWNDVTDALGTVKLESRQRAIWLRPDLLLLDDAYNAAPMSVLAALELVASAPGTKVGVLGDMLELGPSEEASHREVGARAAEVLEWLVVRGDRAAWIADEAERGGMETHHVLRADSNTQAAEFVRSILHSYAKEDRSTRRMQRQPGAVIEAPSGFTILVKGSRGMRMEEIVQELERSAL